MPEVDLDLMPATDAPHGGHQPKGLIWLDHDSSLRPAKPVRHPALFPCSTWPSRILSVSRAGAAVAIASPAPRYWCAPRGAGLPRPREVAHRKAGEPHEHPGYPGDADGG